MADGDLEARVDIGGNDEVADMAAALEVFRRHALEVQRLNLVEKLAEELREKNDQLEKVLADLRRAQDQIVMREKLAALGELTAGVAHEIKNPLNFVKNFSEVSEELLEELLEELQGILSEDGGWTLSEDQRGLIQEICQDLTDNLGRIREHGERANRIVHDMLSMGRGSAERQPTDINHLLDEHARLAYHSVRASDPNFQLDIKQDLDPQTGQLEVVSQDMGRVFLNMVSNACHATDEKRRTSAPATPGDAPYAPTLWLKTRRGPGMRRDFHPGQRERNSPRCRRQDFQPFLHDQADRQGYRARSCPVQRYRSGARRNHPGRDRIRRIYRDGCRIAPGGASDYGGGRDRWWDALIVGGDQWRGSPAMFSSISKDICVPACRRGDVELQWRTCDDAPGNGCRPCLAGGR